jgi:capsular polysaccharide transport system permease protein
MVTLPDQDLLAKDGMRARRFKTGRTVMALILREMSTTYGRSPGGYLWAILEPLGAIVVLTFGFSLLLRNPPIGSSFILFFASGYLPFGMYMNISNLVARSLKFSRPLLAYPGVTFLDALLARFLLNGMTQVLVFIIVMVGIIMFQDTGAIVDVSSIVLAISLALLLGLGVGCMNAVMIGFFPVWANLWSIAMRPLFFVSGIFFLFESMPRSLQDLLWINPLMHVTGIMRRGFYTSYEASYASPVYCALVGGGLLMFGLLFLGRYAKVILKL